MKLMKHKIWISMVAATLVLGGCSKDFLNDPAPTADVSDKDVFRTASGVRAYFTGIYRNMRRQWSNLDATAGGATDTWGYNSLNISRVMKGIDIINPGGWYQFDYRQENREPTYRRVVFTWGFLFEHINQANVIIKGVTESGMNENDKNALLAEARALRAWLYFEAIREFQHTVTANPQAPGLPLYTEPTSLENKGKPRGTVAEVYALINEDIAFATANLGTARELKSQINSNVAWGMAARIYLEQERWADAADAAQKARQGYDLDRNSYRGAYTNLASTEVIWGFPQTTENGGQSLYYGTPSSFYEKTGNGYDNFFVASTLVSTFSNTDIRNTFFLTSANPASQIRFSTNKFGSESGDDLNLINGEVVKLRETDFNEGLPMMRVAEMILIEAEAKAELGDATAADLLYELQLDRDPNAVASGNTGQALIDEILLERRKELYGELGIDYLDIKRRQLSLVRTANHPVAYRFTFQPNDPRLILKIPQKEIDSNEFIDDSDQNP